MVVQDIPHTHSRTASLTYATTLTDLKKTNCQTVQLGDHTIVLFAYGEQVYAVDNRCPHMGFPLNKGTVKDGLLTCHWHHARFDLATGGTFDQWADDVRAFPVEVRDGEVWVDLAPQTDIHAYRQMRLRVGLERNISLVIAKAVIGILNETDDDTTSLHLAAQPFRTGLEFGTRYRGEGWGQGLTILGCMMNLIPHLTREERARALYHGLSSVANDTDGMAPRFLLEALPGEPADMPTLKRWFRQFIEVRDTEAAERCIITAVRAGATPEQMADMLFAAATDHRYIDIGHPLDFVNKAFEGLDIAGWDYAEMALTALVPGLARADRMEESNQWRYPIDLIEILDATFAQLTDAVETGRSKSAKPDFEALTPILLGDDPQVIVDSLLETLKSGVSMVDLAGLVAYAAARRIAHFHTSNEFGDWDTALHTFTFANAVHQGLRRILANGELVEPIIPDLLRGVFDAAMSCYLDRFLNVPAARLPRTNGTPPNTLLAGYAELLDRQQQVNEAGALVGGVLANNGDTTRLIAEMGRLLLREDRNFHTIQCVEAAVKQYGLLSQSAHTAAYAPHVLIAAARYLAAHAPTMRAQGQTYQIAHRLWRGEALFEE